MSLNDGERALLEFEGSWWTRPGTKAGAIRDRFGFSATSYYRRLALLVDSPDALAEAPLVIRRLRRRRVVQRRHRFEGAAAPHPYR
ncbi:MAG TPA: DUF3263 domain-containing protein [Acidimicrobiales bacterium]|nr:DUF3263 domain-containing protein [Acidimicrobiales bacterium]